MIKLSQIDKYFAEQAHYRGNMILYKHDVAIEYVEKCRDENVVLLGFDGFYLWGKKIQPSMEHSIDFTLSYQPKDIDRYQASLKLLKECPKEMYFEFVCEV